MENKPPAALALIETRGCRCWMDFSSRLPMSVTMATDSGLCQSFFEVNSSFGTLGAKNGDPGVGIRSEAEIDSYFFFVGSF
ncbi:MAG: hypothetical protein ACTHKU_16795, partial [Verrucomicrobiota bacterium]